MSYETCFNAHPYWLSTINQFALPLQFASALPETYQEHLQTALQQENKGDYAAALQSLQLASAELPDPAQDQGLALHCEAILQLLSGEIAEAEALFLLSLEIAPEVADYYYNIGVFLLKCRQDARDIKRAVGAFQQALAHNSGHARACAALAMLYTLSRDWPQAETLAQQALQLGARLGNGLLDLCRFAATYAQQRAAEDIFSLRSLSLDAPTAIDGALNFFPGVDKRQLQHPANSPLILFVGCDSQYFLDHAIALLGSLKETGAECAVHIHLFNPDIRLQPLLPALAARLKPLRLQFSHEHVALEHFAPAPIYYSCVRFCRLYQLRAANPQADILAVDADVLFNRPPRQLSQNMSDGQSVGLTYLPNEPLWDRICAGANYFAANDTDGLRFLAQTALFISDNFQAGTARWFLDQVALFLAQGTLPAKNKIHYFSPARSFDLSFSRDAVIWAVTNELKFQKNAYNDYKKLLLDKYSTGSL